MTTAIEIVQNLAPSANKIYREAFENGGALLDQYGINTDLRLAHFMAQSFHETAYFTVLTESGNYREKGLARMWDGGNWHRYFDSRADCLAMADQCRIDKGEALFNRVYARKTLGNVNPGDGWKYRGRGIIQTTGRYAYRKYGRTFRVPFEDQPELVITAEHALKPALAEWADGNLNAAADQNDIEVITKTINGGLVGLPERRAAFARVWTFVAKGAAIEDSIEYRVQVALNAAGFGCGKPDGVVGPNTRRAILRFCAKRGLPPSAYISHALVNALQI